MGRGYQFAFCVPVLVVTSFAQSPPTQEFQQTYALASDKIIRVRNDFGSVHVTAWDRQDVKVDAIKRAVPPAKLESADIAVQQSSTDLCVATKYPAAKPNIKTWFGFTLDLCREWQNISAVNPADLPTIDYTLSVPRNAHLIILVDNGDVDIAGTTGELMVDIQKGHLTARDVSGDCKLYGSFSGVNVTLNSLNRDTHIQSAVGPLVVYVSPAVSARIRAYGPRGIENDFGWQNRAHEELQASLGDGKALLEVSSSSGRVEIRRLQPPAPPPATERKTRHPVARPKSR